MLTSLRAGLLGFATGGRSSLGLATLALTAPSSGSWLTGSQAKTGAVLAVAGELTADKLPQTPSRLQPLVLLPRLGFGAAAGAILAHRAGQSRSATIRAGLAGAAGAGAGSVLGVRWRALAADRFGADWPGAVAEDVVAIGTAYAAGRQR